MGLDKRVKTKILRKRIGEKVVLKTLEGDLEFYVIPKKYSVTGAEDVAAVSVGMADKIPEDLMDKLEEYQDKKKKSKDDFNFSNFLKTLSWHERSGIMQLASEGKSAEYLKTVLKNGVSEHNLSDAEKPESLIDDELLNDLCEYPDVIQEIVNIIEGFNRPLVK